jgi:hypothetical protein
MRGKYLRKLGGFILAALMLPGLLMLSSGTAQAQRRVIIVRRPFLYRPFYDPFYYDRFSRFNYYNQYVFSSSETAYNQGYHDGLKTGESDRKHDRSYDPDRSHYFQDAGFGNFAESYRDGFTRGYADGFKA